MWEINQENGMIRMTKGDTPSFKIDCSVKDEKNNLHSYIPEDGDLFIFAVKQNKEDSEPLFSIEIPNDTMTVTFKQEDTKGLEMGKYFYEVSLNRPDIGYHCTFIYGKILKLEMEIY